MTTPTANDTRSQIDTIWNALHSHRETCIPEGTPEYDEEWNDICSAMDGHGGDPHYNGVVVHGVLQVNSEATTLPSGGQAPVVDLSALLEATPAQEPHPDLWEMLARSGFPRPGSMAETGSTLKRPASRRGV